MVELVSSLGGDYIAPGLSFASFALSVPITDTTARSRSTYIASIFFYLQDTSKYHISPALYHIVLSP